MSTSEDSQDIEAPLPPLPTVLPTMQSRSESPPPPPPPPLTPERDIASVIRSTLMALEGAHIRQRKKEAKSLLNVSFQKLEAVTLEQLQPERLVGLSRDEADAISQQVYDSLRAVMRGLAVTVVKHYDAEAASLPGAADTESVKQSTSELRQQLDACVDSVEAISRGRGSLEEKSPTIDEGEEWDAAQEGSLVTTLHCQRLAAGSVPAPGTGAAPTPQLARDLLERFKLSERSFREGTVTVTESGVIVRDAATQETISMHPAHRIRLCCRVPRDDKQKSKWVALVATRQPLCLLLRLDRPKDLLDPIKRIVQPTWSTAELREATDAVNRAATIAHTPRVSVAQSTVAGSVQSERVDGEGEGDDDDEEEDDEEDEDEGLTLSSGQKQPVMKQRKSVRTASTVSTSNSNTSGGMGAGVGGRGRSTTQALFHDDLGDPLVRYQGYLVKRGARVKSWKKRYFKLTSQDLQYYRSDTSRSAIRSISVSDIVSVGKVDSGRYGKERQYAFYAETPAREFVFVAESADEQRQWIDALVQVVPSFMLGGGLHL